MFPLKLGSDDQFRRLQAGLAECGFSEQAICDRCGIPAIFRFTTLREGRSTGEGINDRLDALIRLLMDGHAIPADLLRSLLPESLLAELLALDVVRPTEADASLLGATVHLYCVGGLFIASDRTFPLNPSDSRMPEEVVYPAITTNTGRFLCFIPTDPCESLLELCAGTGAAAFIAASRYARRACASDLGARATHFAEFNRRLNNLQNAEAVQGDLYAAVSGQQFDRIIAHPPYVPAGEQLYLFRDGGEDGEMIFRRVVEGLPGHLSPGGRAYVLTRATDRQDAPLQDRVRRWLGDSHEDFDVFVVVHNEQPGPEEFEKLAAKFQGHSIQVAGGSALYRHLKVTQILYAVVVVQRHAETRPPLTNRTRKAIHLASDAVEWFRLWHVRAAEPGFHRILLAARPRPNSTFRLEVTHAFEGGELTPVDFQLKSEYPYLSNARIQPWLTFLLGLCNGNRTVSDILQELRAQEVVDGETADDEILSVFVQLLGSGFLEIDEYPLPGPSAVPVPV